MSQGPVFAPGSPSWPEELSAQDAAYRLVHICELLEVFEVPAELIEELRTLGRRFVHQLHALPDFQERLIEWARRYCR